VAQRVPAYLAFRVLAATTGCLCFLFGLLFFSAFVDRALFQVFAHPLFATNHWGYYVLGFASAALFAWGGCLLAAARTPASATGIANATVVGLLASAIMRLLAWYSGEYWLVRDELRVEAAVLALLALGFVWLRPPPAERSGP
jgi:hypothetical protein